MSNRARAAGAVTAQPLVELRAQWDELREELGPEVEGVFASGAFIGGERVARFEAAFAALCGAAHCVGVGNGTDALHLALRAAGVEAGDEVITAANTFVATVEAVQHACARPVLVDVRPGSLLLVEERLDGARCPRTRAVVPVHLYGQLCDMEAIEDWCARHGILLVEDAAQAHGAARGGRVAGAFGIAAGFSFYPGKNLGAAGDAGAVTTSSDDVARKLRLLRDHGQSERYRHDLKGYNSRLDALQAAVLTVKLRHLARWNQQRRALAGLYRARLESLPDVELLAPPKHPDSHVHHLFVARTPQRDALRHHLEYLGSEPGLNYPVHVHIQEAYRSLGYSEGAFPVAEAAAREVLSLPLYPQMTVEAVHRVCDAVESFLRR